MKTSDNHFRGFRRCGMRRRSICLLHLRPWLSSLLVAALIVLTFVPFNVCIPSASCDCAG
jgi:phosphatidylcholine synthase